MYYSGTSLNGRRASVSRTASCACLRPAKGGYGLPYGTV